MRGSRRGGSSTVRGYAPRRGSSRAGPRRSPGAVAGPGTHAGRPLVGLHAKLRALLALELLWSLRIRLIPAAIAALVILASRSVTALLVLPCLMAATSAA